MQRIVQDIAMSCKGVVYFKAPSTKCPKTCYLPIKTTQNNIIPIGGKQTSCKCVVKSLRDFPCNFVREVWLGVLIE